MSAAVKFTKVSHNPSNNKTISFTQELGIGTVIYIKDNSTAIKFIKESSNTFKKTEETYNLPQNHGLTLNTYYVVIKNPCGDASTEEFFNCETSSKTPILTQISTSSGAKLLEDFKPPTTPINIKIYKLLNIKDISDKKKIYSASVNLLTILNNLLSKQKEILKITSGDTKIDQKNVLSARLYELYNAWVNNVYMMLQKEENKPETLAATTTAKTGFIENIEYKQYQSALLKRLNTMHASFSVEADKLLNKTQIEQILRKYRSDDIIQKLYTGRNLSTIYNQLYNDENYLKINFIYLEQINNLFCLHAIDKGILTPETAKPYFSKLQMSTLDRKNTENNNIINIFSYKKNFVSDAVYDKYYLKGVDKSIREEYGEEKVKSLPETDEGEVYNVTLQNITMSGGASKKTKKRHMKSRNQSKKTKKSNRK
jgi:hypothetical protein